MNTQNFKDTENENAALASADEKIIEKISLLLGLNQEELRRVGLIVGLLSKKLNFDVKNNEILSCSMQFRWSFSGK